MGQSQTKVAGGIAGGGGGGGSDPPPCGYGAGSQASSSSNQPCPVDLGPSTSSSSSSSSSQAPPAVYNVYNQRIDAQGKQQKSEAEKRKESNFRSIWNFGWGGGSGAIDSKNNMPLEANQQPSVGQLKPLSVDREPSTIPKGGTESTWTYPSPQMFFNALNRKGKADGVDEEDMENVIFFHNGMNERTWEMVKRWEALHHAEYDEKNQPKLSRFLGRPHDLSPMARVRSLFYGDVPFDRHDWYVDRNGEEVRYVIDFYFDEEKAGTMEAFEVQARPALDSFTSCLDRVKMNIYVTCAQYGLPCPISGQPGHIGKEGANAGER
eukprot:CAMPEP_0198461712 /NCGR_PEP_ID=MMETSP1456-20131121/393_1 /TAXON_ID=1461544 ORGANISM="Unidentified sp., Strain RCC1871" /NCGR_SAMPLE_ID=MMETSP1456 /ASSEMBLY_ACC=CAM_ASM_001119 /LENGTH=321 /DNA_ID=CAMNT_0044186781 /DNA_START=60 /DNA_END=1028 /DNA_ORIENTATION=-